MRRPKSRGNHSGSPVSRKITAHAAIVQKYIFWPPLKKPTSSASTASSFDTYDLIRLIQRESAGVHHIGSSQLSNCSAKNTTKPRLCLLYTSDAADERSSVDLGGRRIIKKKKK